MDDGPAALGDHRRQESSVEADGRHEVGVQIAHPVVVGEVGGSSWCVGLAAGVGHDDVDPAEQVERLLGEGVHPVGGGHVGPDEAAGGDRGRLGARGDDDRRTGSLEAVGHGCADSLSASGDEGSNVGQVEGIGHGTSLGARRRLPPRPNRCPQADAVITAVARLA